MDATTPLWKAHDISQQLQDKLEALPNVERAFVHVDHETDHTPVSIYLFLGAPCYVISYDCTRRSIENLCKLSPLNTKGGPLASWAVRLTCIPPPNSGTYLIPSISPVGLRRFDQLSDISSLL